MSTMRVALVQCWGSLVTSKQNTAAVLAGVSVMDRDRLWYKAVSFGDVPHGFQQPRRMGFCHWALLAPNPEVTVVPDMTKDIRQALRLWICLIHVVLHSCLAQADQMSRQLIPA